MAAINMMAAISKMARSAGRLDDPVASAADSPPTLLQSRSAERPIYGSGDRPYRKSTLSLLTLMAHIALCFAMNGWIPNAPLQTPVVNSRRPTKRRSVPPPPQEGGGGGSPSCSVCEISLAGGRVDYVGCHSTHRGTVLRPTDGTCLRLAESEARGVPALSRLRCSTICLPGRKIGDGRRRQCATVCVRRGMSGWIGLPGWMKLVDPVAGNCQSRACQWCVPFDRAGSTCL